MKISIVTPSYNQADFIEQTILSVINQRYENLEYIIIDGGSTDRTAEIIKKYEKYLAYWVSEPDRGQVHAINKGLEKCTGELFNWINSDDLLEDGALDYISRNFGKADLLAGRVIEFTENQQFPFQNQNLDPGLLARRSRHTKFHQPGLWWRLKNLRSILPLNETMHFSFDLELLMKYLYHFPEVKYTDQIFARFRLHEQSKTMSFEKDFNRERIMVYEQLLSNSDYRAIHKELNRTLSIHYWQRYIIEMVESDGNRWGKTAKLLINALRDPTGRINRFLLGHIKNILSS